MWGIVKGVFVLAVLGYFAAGYFFSENTKATTEPWTFHVSESTSPEDREIARQAVKALINVCSNFPDYREDIVSIEAETGKNVESIGSYQNDLYGWPGWVWVRVKVSDEPKQIPAHYRANGHTLHYYLGGGHRPGIAAQKRASEMVCGTIPLTKKGNGFLDVPVLTLVDQLK